MTSAPFSVVGVQLAEWIEDRYGDSVGSASAKVIGAALVLGGLGFLAKTYLKRGVQPDDAPFLLHGVTASSRSASVPAAASSSG